MNPMQYWYETNSSLRFFFDTYFRENINILSDYPELKMDCVKLFTEGKGTEKVQAISLLAAAKLLL